MRTVGYDCQNVRGNATEANGESVRLAKSRKPWKQRKTSTTHDKEIVKNHSARHAQGSLNNRHRGPLPPRREIYRVLPVARNRHR